MDKLTIYELTEFIEKNEKEIRSAKSIIEYKNREISQYIKKWLIKKLNFKYDNYIILCEYIGYIKFVLEINNKKIAIILRLYTDKYSPAHIEILLIRKDNESMVSVNEGFRRKFNLQKLYEFYSIEENTKKLLSQKDAIRKLCYETNYIYNLPKAYTFLLSSPFCRDISKLIATKILFASDAPHPRCP